MSAVIQLSSLGFYWMFSFLSIYVHIYKLPMLNFNQYSVSFYFVSL